MHVLEPSVIAPIQLQKCLITQKSKVFLFICFICSLKLLTHGNNENKPHPKKSDTCFSCCYWNLDSLIAHNKPKVSLLKAYNTIHEHDFICISETF